MVPSEQTAVLPMQGEAGTAHELLPSLCSYGSPAGCLEVPPRISSTPVARSIRAAPIPALLQLSRYSLGGLQGGAASRAKGFVPQVALCGRCAAW